jgi:hypothetical protein
LLIFLTKIVEFLQLQQTLRCQIKRIGQQDLGSMLESTIDAVCRFGAMPDDGEETPRARVCKTRCGNPHRRRWQSHCAHTPIAATSGRVKAHQCLAMSWPMAGSYMEKDSVRALVAR